MRFPHGSFPLVSLLVGISLAADTVTVTLFSGANCDGNTIETAKLGMASVGVCKNADAAYGSLRTTNIGQSFFNQGIKIRLRSGTCGDTGIILQTDQDLTNDPKRNCHGFGGSSSFELVRD